MESGGEAGFLVSVSVERTDSEMRPSNSNENPKGCKGDSPNSASLTEMDGGHGCVAVPDTIGWKDPEDNCPGDIPMDTGVLARHTVAHGAENSFHLPESSEFEEVEAFLQFERDHATRNLHSSGGQKTLMASHSWRNPATQSSKRQLIAALSRNGWSLWADFLDLQANGPVPWRKEIEEGIFNCAKVVMFVDKAYLDSFNCLQEVAFAIAFNKPIVIVILEQEAIDRLTSPDGVAKGWEELKTFEGKPLTPGLDRERPLTKDGLQEVYDLLASINFCMCRPLDFTNDTNRVVVRRMLQFVSVELAYQKEHASLMSKAMEWNQRDRETSYLPNEEAVKDYEMWIRLAKERGQMPQPTPLQEEFVRHGSRRANRARRIKQALSMSGLLAVVVGGLAVFAALQMFEAQRQGAHAQEEASRANSEAERATQLGRASLAQQYVIAAKLDAATCCAPQAAVREAVAIAEQLPPSIGETILREAVGWAQQRLRDPTLYLEERALPKLAAGDNGRKPPDLQLLSSLASPDGSAVALIDDWSTGQMLVDDLRNGQRHVLLTRLGHAVAQVLQTDHLHDMVWRRSRELLVVTSTAGDGLAVLSVDVDKDCEVTVVLELTGQVKGL